MTRVPNFPYQRRIQRALELRERHIFAAEILGFYIAIARFHAELSEQFRHQRTKNRSGEELSAEEAAALAPKFAAFFSAVEQYGTETLAQIAQLLRGSEQSWPDLLASSWTALNPSEPTVVLTQAFLQPYAELLRSQASQTPVNAAHAVCPFCHRKPCFGVLRQMGEGASRSMVCAFCSAEWDFRRLVCPGCGEEDDRKLPIYTADAFNYIRVECCDTCKTYVKAIDLTKNGRAEPIVDELASVPLDLWARERGYAKLHANLLGL